MLAPLALPLADWGSVAARPNGPLRAAARRPGGEKLATIADLRLLFVAAASRLYAKADPGVVKAIEAELGPRWVIAFPAGTRFLAAEASTAGVAAIRAALDALESPRFERLAPATYRVDAGTWTRLD